MQRIEFTQGYIKTAKERQTVNYGLGVVMGTTSIFLAGMFIVIVSLRGSIGGS